MKAVINGLAIKLTLATVPLSILDSPRYWNNAFEEYEISYAQHLIISEKEVAFLQNDEYQLLFQFLTTNDSGGFSSEEEEFALFLCKRLEEKGVLLTSPSTTDWLLPSFKYSSRFDLSGNSECIVLSENEVAVKALRKSLGGLGEISNSSILLVDDLLDPRILEVVSNLTLGKNTFVIVALEGTRILIGPGLKCNSGGNMALMAMLEAVERNRKVESWCQKECGFFPASPRNGDPYQDLVIEPEVIRLLFTQLDEPFSGNIHEVEFAANQVITHWIPGFMDSKQAAVKAEPDVILSFKGGYRICEPEETLAKIDRYISPLTGVIGALKCLNPQEKGLKIYGASFSRYPRKDNLLLKRDFEQYTLGKGISDVQSKVSALAEAIERSNALCTGTENSLFGTPDQLPRRVLLPRELKPYSARQYQEFGDNPDHQDSVEIYSDSIPLHWIEASSLVSEEIVFVPLAYCYANAVSEDERYIRFNSNGSAAGNTVEEAIVQGFLELVERDAVALWWYNKIPRPKVHFEFGARSIHSVISESLDLEWDYWVLDITTDFEIPCFVAVGQHKEGGQYRLGFSAHFDPEIALERALTELYQLIVVGKSKTQLHLDQLEEDGFLSPEVGHSKSLASSQNYGFQSLEDCVEFCSKRIEDLGLDLFYINTTRPWSPLATVKVLVPGLCFFWPELGNPRLYSLPQKLGWLESVNTEDSLNDIPLFL